MKRLLLIATLLLLLAAPAAAQVELPVSTHTADVNADFSRGLMVMNTTGGALAVSLPAPKSRPGAMLGVCVGGANAVTITTRGTDATVGGSSSLVLSVEKQCVLFSADAKNNQWLRVSDFGATTALSDDAVTFAKMQNITTDRLLGRDTASTGDPEQLTVGGGVEFTGSGGIQRSALTGDVTASAGSGATTIAAAAVTSAKLDEKIVQYAEATISSANITGTSAGQLGHAAGVEVVAAPGAGKVIEVISCAVIYDFATAAYTDGGNVGLKYTGSDLVTGVVSAANSLAAAGDKVALLLPAVPTNNQMLTNTGLSLTAATAFTQPGTAAGVVRVKVAYRVHTTGL